MTSSAHTFHAVAFVENLALKELAPSYPEAKRTPHELWYATPAGGTVFVYPFGAMVFHNVPPAEREAQVARLHAARPKLTNALGFEESFAVREEPGARPDVQDGVLVLDNLSFEGASVVAMTVAQSAAMDYYDRIVDEMFSRTDRLVERLEKAGRPPFATRPLHRFIGTAIGTRNEVLSTLHMLDKPDAVWEDVTADRIYHELRAEFDLSDRYQALELKLRSVQEALELVLDMTRDSRLVMLEATVVLLIVIEIVLNLIHR
ncbi:MAG: RMD1 family protein [Burkholderiales bacterium]